MIVGREDGLVLTDDPSRLDVDRICAWLATSYWASDRPRDAVVASLSNSMTFGAYLPDGSQVGLCRAVTDSATFAWLADVYVDDDHRGRGIGSWMVAAVVDHLTALGTPRIVLATRDAHEVYARIGFEPVRVPATLMEIDRRATRPNPEDVTPYRAASS